MSTLIERFFLLKSQLTVEKVDLSELENMERREALLRKQRALSKQMKAAGTHLLTGHKYSRNTTHLERTPL